MTTETDTKQKLYNNGKTYAQNIADGTFIPVKHIQNHKEVMTEVAEMKAMMSNIAQELASLKDK
jgi:hypothetical protein|tara:strand:+ start:292 stop:483 length:192 start_codon:yes stop_codon:yes gene_type:complete